MKGLHSLAELCAPAWIPDHRSGARSLSVACFRSDSRKELSAVCRVNTTGLDEERRMLVRTVVSEKYLGGKTSRVFNRNVTHLIARHAAGMKYTAALEYGIPTVTLDWLLDSVTKGGAPFLLA